MVTGKVIGSVVSTIKNGEMTGIKLLVVQIMENGKSGRMIVAADAIGVAGVDDDVYLVSSREAAMAFEKSLLPVDAAIVGIIDRYNVQIDNSKNN